MTEEWSNKHQFTRSQLIRMSWMYLDICEKMDELLDSNVSLEEFKKEVEKIFSYED